MNKIFLPKLVIVLVALVAFASVVFSVPLTMVSMEHHESMPMEGCPFMFGGTLCAMSIFEHISVWQLFANVIVPEMVTLVLLIVFCVYWSTWRLHDPPELFSVRIPKYAPFLQTTTQSSLLLKCAISPRAP